MPGQPSVYVHLLPSLIPPGALKGGVAIALDVLRATTAMVHALDSGIESIRPCVEIEEARRLAATFPKASVILAGERQGVTIDGFDFGNSPSSFTPEICRGKTLVMTTTNGTRAIHASLQADRVFIAAFSNATVTIEAARSDSKPIHIVCAGTDNLISIEDSALAGFLVKLLDDGHYVVGNDSAEIAQRLWMFSEERLREKLPLEEDVLISGRGGRRVRELGMVADIHTASQMDCSNIVAELRRDPLRIVSV